MRLQETVRQSILGTVGALVLGFGVTAQADIAVEFGHGAQKLSVIDFTGDVSQIQEVVIGFFDDDLRDLESFACYQAELRGL
ncbi:MAG: hypothetical protein U9Q81_00240 [Pseudomonadota bacterium]|nr:hypothetical protein [Pseudomonadota bacterium]